MGRWKGAVVEGGNVSPQLIMVKRPWTRSRQKDILTIIFDHAMVKMSETWSQAFFHITPSHFSPSPFPHPPPPTPLLFVSKGSSTAAAAEGRCSAAAPLFSSLSPHQPSSLLLFVSKGRSTAAAVLLHPFFLPFPSTVVPNITLQIIHWSKCLAPGPNDFDDGHVIFERDQMATQ